MVIEADKAMNESDILLIAQTLIQVHGEGAWYEAAQRADHAIEDCNWEAGANWKRILRTIEALQNLHLGASVTKH